MKNHLVQVVDRARQGFKRSRSGGVSASQLDLVPSELWQQIFSYLWLPWDLKAVSLTCQSFRYLAQPLLFTKIYTHPRSMTLRGLQPNKYRRRTTQRLEFFLSPHIAPAVREAWIDPPLAEDDDLPTDVLIDAIFEGLRKLPNLSGLGCRSVRLTSKRLAILHRLSLTTLSLESCLSDLQDFTDLRAIPLYNVTFKYHDLMSHDAVLPPLLSLFLSPRHLQRLSSTSTQILPVIIRGRPFTRLFHLEIPVASLASDLLVTALSRLPALERITLQTDADGRLPPRTSVPAALPADLLPNLKFYRGPRNYASLFAGTGRVQIVELALPAKAHRLLRTLEQLPCAETVDFLSFRIDGNIPKTLLESVHTALPALRTLSINDPPMPSTQLTALLGAERTPRPNMRVLRVRVEGRDRYNLWIPPLEEAADCVDCFKRCGAEIERVYPNLTTLKLLYGVEGGAVVWRRSGETGQLRLA
ncbi:hypothetical protein DFH06DRAFT_1246684 [Mycena polygramma]|nr:hypothetical protein DFH06DRAFT_1246684 [Mycena polygramma]